MEPLREIAHLSKLVFFSLPPGALLVSNIGADPWTPAFSDVVAESEDQRHKQWLLIKAARADKRKAALFVDREHHRAWIEAALAGGHQSH
jgi:hypothetical protein